MIEIMDKIGISRQERRAVILLLLIILVVGNGAWLFMEPQLFVWRDSLIQLTKNNDSNATLPIEIKKLRASKETLETETGKVEKEKQAQALLKDISSKARRLNINFTKDKGVALAGSKKNEFEEYKRMVSFQSSLGVLVQFLKSVSDGKSMIRVSNMTVVPTRDRKALMVELAFIASYTKSPPARTPKSTKRWKTPICCEFHCNEKTQLAMKVLTGHLLITRVFNHPESGERRLLVEDYHGHHNLQVHDSYSSSKLNMLGNLLNFKDLPPNRVVRIYDNFVSPLIPKSKESCSVP